MYSNTHVHMKYVYYGRAVNTDSNLSLFNYAKCLSICTDNDSNLVSTKTKTFHLFLEFKDKGLIVVMEHEL